MEIENRKQEATPIEHQKFPVPSFNEHQPHIPSFDVYKKLYKESIQNPDGFWEKIANREIDWIRPFTKVSSGSFIDGDIAWFLNGQLNVSYNCIDRHAEKTPDKVAIIWEPDEPGHHQTFTFKQVLQHVSRIALVLKKYNVGKGDTVAIYMPMVPEAAFAMLACARIGAIHSVIFAGFSAEALRDRIQDASCKILITADQGKRGGKFTNLKAIADEALKQCATIKKVIVFQRTGDVNVPFTPGRDVWWHEEVKNQRSYCPPEPMNSEDPLFMLYTSGSTGKPKGVLHTQAGYLLGTLLTSKYIFDHHENDVHGCMADIGWITGHSYIVYGPLACGSTTVMFESVPTYPTPGRYWEMVDQHKITAFYTAPTAIRALRKLGEQHVKPFKLDSLRVIGSVGEPINPEAWEWYFKNVGRERCAVVDTYWQTETGSIIITPLPGATVTKPGSATFPFFGIDPVILDPATGKELSGNGVTGVLAIRQPFPSIARYLDVYMRPYHGYYFTGDGASIDQDGYIWIKGRVDDVINISGHRLSTAEIESALILHVACAEAAVVGIPDDLTGQSMVCFCTLKSHANTDNQAIVSTLRQHIRAHIGAFATPKKIILVPDLPKTRSGKIMRRILRKIASGEVSLQDVEDEQRLLSVLGDLTTLADPSIIQHLIQKTLE